MIQPSIDIFSRMADARNVELFWKRENDDRNRAFTLRAEVPNRFQPIDLYEFASRSFGSSEEWSLSGYELTLHPCSFRDEARCEMVRTIYATVRYERDIL